LARAVFGDRKNGEIVRLDGRIDFAKTVQSARSIVKISVSCLHPYKGMGIEGRYAGAFEL
jgi:hypothetical protein